MVVSWDTPSKRLAPLFGMLRGGVSIAMAYVLVSRLHRAEIFWGLSITSLEVFRCYIAIDNQAQKVIDQPPHDSFKSRATHHFRRSSRRRRCLHRNLQLSHLSPC